MYNLADFKEYELYPALWNRIDTIFPELDFKMSGGYWKSSKHMDGSPSQAKDKTYIHFRKPHLISENGGESMSLIDYVMKRDGIQFRDALRYLADKCGLAIPDSDTEEYKQYECANANREEANNIFKSALWDGSQESLRVLDYLRNVRQWTDEEIKKAELGYINEEIKHNLKDSSELTDPHVGTSHRLSIPYRNGSRLLGFKFRDIDCKEGQKYRNSKGLAKSKGFFGIGIGVKDVTIVEGELDCLHAIVRGATNVVATTGNAASEGQIEDAIRRGVKRFTLLFDNDDAGYDYVARTIRVVEPTKAEAYVCYLPEGSNDTDDYLKTHSIEEWKAIVENAIPSYVWKYNQVFDRLSSLCDSQNGTISMKQREDFFADVEQIINAPSMLPQNREIIYSLMKRTEEDTVFKVDDFREWADKSYLRKRAKDRRASTEDAVFHVQELLKEGKTDEALKLMKQTVDNVGLEERGNKFAKTFALPTPSEISQYLSQMKEGIPTGYTFSQPGLPTEPLTLNPGLTFVCAYRGHGKTSFLNNIALNEVRRLRENQSDKSVLYFSYEVERRRLMVDMLNTFVNDPELGVNPANTCTNYFRGKETFFTSTKYQGKSHKEHFEERKNIFLKDYICSGKLTIVDESYKVGELLDAIKYYTSIRKVSIVCIDYAQLIYSEDYSRARTEEIKKVVNDIKDFANREEIPFVLAAQFNREVDSPVSVDTKNIGEGGDFERIADTCIGLFNLKELHPLPKNKEEERDAKFLLGKLLHKQLDQLEPIRDKIFVRLMKRRYGFYPIDILLDWEGRTKVIKQNDPNFLLPKQGEIRYQ